MLENVVKRCEFVYTREQRYTKVMHYYCCCCIAYNLLLLLLLSSSSLCRAVSDCMCSQKRCQLLFDIRIVVVASYDFTDNNNYTIFTLFCCYSSVVVDKTDKWSIAQRPLAASASTTSREFLLNC